ncbi:MAG: DUF29 domain-containing protein [Verrucomicrobia bacterium]|nr:DUF29 domain-containing protein [Verrucomicrobiota bacterium]
MSSAAKKRLVYGKSESIPVTVLTEKTASEYEKDFYKWTLDQSKLLKKGDYTKLDIENLIEEIESLGRSEKRTLESFLKKLLMHLLKITFQPGHHTSSWDNSIKLARIDIREVLVENPSLKRKLPEIFDRAYKSARLLAASETGLEEKTFPTQCPWTYDECMEDAGLPAKEREKPKKKKK